MAQIAAAMTLLGLAGGLAGIFLPAPHLAVLSAVGLVYCAYLQDRMRRQPDGSVGGYGPLLFLALSISFLVAMWGAATMARHT